jgi:hypothetical protein
MEGRLPPKTHVRTQGHEDVRYVNLNLGGTDQMYFQAMIVRELGGEFTHNLGASLVSMNPHGLILIIDGQYPTEEADVLLKFGKSLYFFYEKLPIQNVALKSILIIINKYDLVSDSTMNSVMGAFREHYGTLFAFLQDKLPDVQVSVCCGSITHPQFFAPVENGMRFLRRAVQ